MVKKRITKKMKKRISLYKNFGGKRYQAIAYYPRKTEAKKRVDSIRKSGNNARISKNPEYKDGIRKGYTVYRRPKK